MELTVDTSDQEVRETPEEPYGITEHTWEQEFVDTAEESHGIVDPALGAGPQKRSSPTPLFRYINRHAAEIGHESSKVRRIRRLVPLVRQRLSLLSSEEKHFSTDHSSTYPYVPIRHIIQLPEVSVPIYFLTEALQAIKQGTPSALAILYWESISSFPDDTSFLKALEHMENLLEAERSNLVLKTCGAPLPPYSQFLPSIPGQLLTSAPTFLYHHLCSDTSKVASTLQSLIPSDRYGFLRSQLLTFARKKAALLQTRLHALFFSCMAQHTLMRNAFWRFASFLTPRDISSLGCCSKEMKTITFSLHQLSVKSLSIQCAARARGSRKRTEERRKRVRCVLCIQRMARVYLFKRREKREEMRTRRQKALGFNICAALEALDDREMEGEGKLEALEVLNYALSSSRLMEEYKGVDLLKLGILELLMKELRYLRSGKGPRLIFSAATRVLMKERRAEEIVERPYVVEEVLKLLQSDDTKDAEAGGAFIRIMSELNRKTFLEVFVHKGGLAVLMEMMVVTCEPEDFVQDFPNRMLTVVGSWEVGLLTSLDVIGNVMNKPKAWREEEWYPPLFILLGSLLDVLETLGGPSLRKLHSKVLLNTVLGRVHKLLDHVLDHMCSALADYQFTNQASDGMCMYTYMCGNLYACLLRLSLLSLSDVFLSYHYSKTQVF